MTPYGNTRLAGNSLSRLATAASAAARLIGASQTTLTAAIRGIVAPVSYELLDGAPFGDTRG